jgi:streptogramin lyase
VTKHTFAVRFLAAAAAAIAGAALAPTARAAIVHSVSLGSPGSAFDAKGMSLYVSSVDGRVYVYKQGGHLVRALKSGLNYPQGLYVDKQGVLYVANRGASNVLEFKRGRMKPFATLSDGNEQPMDVTLCPDGTVYVANILNASGGSGDIAVYSGGSSSPTGHLTYLNANPFYLSCDRAGNLFATEVVGSTGTVVEFPGGSDSGAKQLPITFGGNPAGIAATANGNLLLAYGQGLEEFTEAGQPTGFSLKTLGFQQIALDAAGSLVLGAAGQTGALYTFPQGQLLHQYLSKGTVLGVAFDSGLY